MRPCASGVVMAVRPCQNPQPSSAMTATPCPTEAAWRKWLLGGGIVATSELEIQERDGGAAVEQHQTEHEAREWRSHPGSAPEGVVLLRRPEQRRARGDHRQVD